MFLSQDVFVIKLTQIYRDLKLEATMEKKIQALTQ